MADQNQANPNQPAGLIFLLGQTAQVANQQWQNAYGQQQFIAGGALLQQAQPGPWGQQLDAEAARQYNDRAAAVQEFRAQLDARDRPTLLALLSPTERERLTAKGYFFVPGQAGRVWQINTGSGLVFCTILYPREHAAQAVCLVVGTGYWDATWANLGQAARALTLLCWLRAEEPYAYQIGVKGGWITQHINPDQEACLALLAEAEAHA